jgi:hypothetical protein
MLVSLAEARDVAVIAYSVAGVVAFLFIFLFTIAIGWTTWRLLRTTQRLLKDNVQPTVESVRQTSESVRGTVEFVSDYAVSPVVKTYGTVAGARQFIAVMTRIGRSRKGS